MDYAIASHIYTCATEAGVVVLDARRSQYSIVPGDRARSLEGTVQGWPALPQVEVVAANQAAPSSLLDSLLGGGIVTPLADPSAPVCRRAAMLTAREALLDALSAREKPEINLPDVGRFFRSVAYAKFMLKCRPFEVLLRELRRRKECGTRVVGQQSIAALRKRVKVFGWLRPFAYAESDACLFDSVVLVDFLFRQGVVADLFMGVRIRPFVAHSWVQAEGFALNELPEYLAAYTPILSV